MTASSSGRTAAPASVSRAVNIRIDRAVYLVAKLVATASDIKLTDFVRAAIEHDVPLRSPQADYAIELLQSAKKGGPPETWANQPSDEPAHDDPPFDMGEGAAKQINVALPQALATTAQILAAADGISLPAYVERALLTYMSSLKSADDLRVLHDAHVIADVKGVLSVVEGLDADRVIGRSKKTKS